MWNYEVEAVERSVVDSAQLHEQTLMLVQRQRYSACIVSPRTELSAQSP